MPMHHDVMLVLIVTALASCRGTSECGQARTSSAMLQKTKVKWQEAEWFGSFDEGESSYVAGVDKSLEPIPEVADVIHISTLPHENSFKPTRWFAETPSAGHHKAWQTFYPPVHGSIVGNRNTHNKYWRDTPRGWVNEYRPSEYTKVVWSSRGAGPHPAGWFENGLQQLDGYERSRLPDKADPRRLQDTGGGQTWEERTVNTSITCAEMGCTANALLQAFDPATEEADFCLMSVAMHATDFEGDYSREVVKNWTVNTFLVTSQCAPQVQACNESAWRPLYPCLTDVPVDRLLQRGDGLLNISGTLSDFVDECPYEGNLLSGVVFVSCMVQTIATIEKTTGSPTDADILPEIIVTAPLQCETKGCTAKQSVYVSPVLAKIGGTCTMDVSVVQTDYDQSLGQKEVIEFVAVEGQSENLSKDVQPGLNPCTRALQGSPVADAEKNFSVVQNVDVTQTLLDWPEGILVVTGKISKYVDECATPAGYLLDGLISVRCVPPANASLLEVPGDAYNAYS